MENEKTAQEIQLTDSQKSLVARVQATNIVSQETLVEAVSFTKEIKQVKAKFKEFVDFFIKPLKLQIAEINERYKPAVDELDKAEIELKGKIVIYQVGQERIRAEEEDRLRKEQQKKYADEIKKAEKKGELAPPPPEPIKVETLKTDGLQIRKIWDFEIVDEAKLTREYLTPDTTKIRKVVNAGIREIPGVRIFQKTTSAISTKELGAEDI